MATLSNKIIGLVGTAMVFAGMSFGQTFTCPVTAASPGTVPAPILDRFEDTTALVADLKITGCMDTAGATTNVVVTLNEPVTSKIVAAATATSEAVLTLIDATTPAASVIVQGFIAGNTVTFLNVPFPGAGDTYSLQVSNIRVNASLAPNGTSNFNITEGLFVTNQGQAVYATPAAITVGYVVSGFGAPKGGSALLPGAAAILASGGDVPNAAICTGNPVTTVSPAAASFSITETEAFGGAFKTTYPQGQTAASVGLCNGLACPVTNGEGGSLTAVPAAFPATGKVNGTVGGTLVAGTGVASHGTRFQLVFNNVPSGVTIYLPANPFNNDAAVGGNAGFSVGLTQTVTGAYAPFTTFAPAKPSGVLLANTMVPFTATGGTFTAVYEILSTDDTFVGESFTVTGAITEAANFSTTALSAITVTESPAPSSGSDIPTFAASSNPAITLTAFSLCQTTLLYPFITNQQGYDTGIEISNTGADPLGLVGATAAGTTGLCNLNFYGAGGSLTTTTLVATPAGFGTATGLAPGSTGAFLLSGTDPGFQGYMIAQCNFLYGHGYAFIFNGLIGTSPNAVAEGYLAEVLLNNRAAIGVGPEAVQF